MGVPHTSIARMENGISLSTFQKFCEMTGMTINFIPAPAPQLSLDEKEVIDHILDIYGDESAWSLRNLTHFENRGKNPWSMAYKSGSSEIISEKSIIEFYQQNKFDFQKQKTH